MLPLEIYFLYPIVLGVVPLRLDSIGIHSLYLITDEGMPTQSSDCQQIFVQLSPDLNIGNDTSSCEGSTLILESNSDETIWQNGNIGSSFPVFESGIIEAKLSNENCTTTKSIEVSFQDCDNCFLIPNAFTPDGDNFNDDFKPILECEELIETYSVQVFNRWGKNVFETSNLEESWDGKINNQPSPSDVFVWKLIYSFEKNGKTVSKVEHGDISLIR